MGVGRHHYITYMYGLPTSTDIVSVMIHNKNVHLRLVQSHAEWTRDGYYIKTTAIFRQRRYYHYRIILRNWRMA